MSSVLQSGRGMEVVAVNVRGGVDGQGKPAYATPVDIMARVVHEHMLVQKADGSAVDSVATLWVDAGQVPLPHEQDQLDLADGTLVTVIDRMDRVTLGGVLDHIRLRVRAGGF